MNDRHMVLTPEKTVVSFRVASFGGRVGAHIVDVILLFAIFYALSMASMGLGLVFGFEASSGFMVFAVSALMFLYFILFEWLWNGLTPGKRAFGIRVVSIDGTPVTLKGAAYRNLLRPADFVPAFYFAGTVAMFLNETSQRIGDIAAGTLVIYEASPNARYEVTPHHAGLHPFEDAIGPLATMTMEDYFMVKRLCDRFPDLPPIVQQRSIDEVWKPFAEKERIEPVAGVHPVYQMEAVIMKYGRDRKLF